MKLFFIVFFIFLLIAALLYLWMICPKKPTTAMRNLLEQKKFAHRGIYDNKGKSPENSMHSFAAAVEKGYAIEMDVRLTKDKKVVVFHDNTLSRMCGIQKLVNSLTLSEIKELRLLDTEQRIPTFEEFLALVNGKVPLLVEFKTGLPGGTDAAEVCSKVMNHLDFYKGEYVIESFDYAVLEWFRNNRPDVMRGQLAMGLKCYIPALGKQGAQAIPLYRKVMLSWLFYNYKSRPHFISYRFQDVGLGVKLCRRLGAMVSVWTVTTPEDSKKLLKQYNAVIFEKFLA